MILILTSIYETLKNEDAIDINVALQVDLCLNWLLNLFDNLRTGQIRVQSFKLGILILCGGPQTEKYIHMFNLLASPQSDEGGDEVKAQMNPRQLGLLLFDCIQIPRMFGEIASFGGSNVEPSVRGCFTQAGSNNSNNSGSSTPKTSPQGKSFITKVMCNCGQGSRIFPLPSIC